MGWSLFPLRVFCEEAACRADGGVASMALLQLFFNLHLQFCLIVPCSDELVTSNENHL
jgi:hypothetical protein